MKMSMSQNRWHGDIGLNRCFEHVFLLGKKKKLVFLDVNHPSRSSAGCTAFGNHWPGWPSGIGIVFAFLETKIYLPFKRKALFVKSLGQQKFLPTDFCQKWDHTEIHYRYGGHTKGETNAFVY